jgi:transposase-like protein
MKVLQGHKSDTIENVIRDSIDEESIIFTDKANTYLDIADHVEIHIST